MNTNIPVAILAHMNPQTLANLIEAYREIEEIKRRVFPTKPKRRKVRGVDRSVRKKRKVEKESRCAGSFFKNESDLETECLNDSSTDCSTDSDEDLPNNGDSDTTVGGGTKGEMLGTVSARSDTTIDPQLLTHDSQTMMDTMTISASDAQTEEATHSADTSQCVTSKRKSGITPMTSFSTGTCQPTRVSRVVSPMPSDGSTLTSDTLPAIAMNEHGLFLCGYGGRCKLAYKSRASVYRHWVNRHNVVPPLQCSQCSARFWALAQLAWHERKCEGGGGTLIGAGTCS